VSLSRSSRQLRVEVEPGQQVDLTSGQAKGSASNEKYSAFRSKVRLVREC
jgi:hypothetical protein